MGQEEFHAALLRIDTASLPPVSIFQGSPLSTADEVEVVWLFLKLFRDMLDRVEGDDDETARLRSVQIGDLLDALDPGDWRSLFAASLNLYAGLWEVVCGSMTEEELDVAAKRCGYGEEPRNVG